MPLYQGKLKCVTTSTSTQGSVYRSDARTAGTTATGVATVISVILAVFGAGSMIGGFVGALDLVAMGGARSALLIGFGLLATGSATLLLLILRLAPR
jgi:hypothetical protein